MMAVRLPVQDTIYFTPPLLLLYLCFWVLMGEWGTGWNVCGGIHCTHKKLHMPVFSESTHKHMCHKLLPGSKRLITGMRSREVEEGEWQRGETRRSRSGPECCAESRPVVTMGHPLLRWQWEWQAYLRGCWRAVTDWADRAVGGCVQVTGCISIWVKNLANVAYVAGGIQQGPLGCPGPVLSLLSVQVDEKVCRLDW